MHHDSSAHPSAHLPDTSSVMHTNIVLDTHSAIEGPIIVSYTLASSVRLRLHVPSISVVVFCTIQKWVQSSSLAVKKMKGAAHRNGDVDG